MPANRYTFGLKKEKCSNEVRNLISLDPHTHYVDHTDPCGSQCEYYGEACPIYTYAPTAPGFDCNRGYCRLNGEDKCIRVPRNAVYAENQDACQSLCKYSAGCPIRPFAPMPPGFNCIPEYCRRTPNSQCIRAVCYRREF